MKYLINFILLMALTVQPLTAQKPEELKSWLPEIEGWKIVEKIEVFSPDNLFDRINGAAPLFIENNFREMTSMEYTKGDDYITIQAYRHATPEDAFGMYASERSPELKFYPFAGEAQGDDSNIFFFVGNIYVKMWGSSSENISEQLQTIAKGLANRIDADPQYPVVLRSFPTENKIAQSESYTTSSYIGHEFLKAVYTTKYKIGDQQFQLFVVDGKSKEGAQDILNKYFSFTKQPLDFKEGSLIVKDRYNGDIPVIWNGQYIIGAFSENGESIANVNGLLSTIEQKLVR